MTATIREPGQATVNLAPFMFNPPPPRPEATQTFPAFQPAAWAVPTVAPLLPWLEPQPEQKPEVVKPLLRRGRHRRDRGHPIVAYAMLTLGLAVLAAIGGFVVAVLVLS
ncbi:MAG: hypothetical protein QOJ49_1258 [Actinomycetota bacterium]|nr:hypothetical protein [Actinomycetota bacterium]